MLGNGLILLVKIIIVFLLAIIVVTLINRVAALGTARGLISVIAGSFVVCAGLLLSLMRAR